MQPTKYRIYWQDFSNYRVGSNDPFPQVNKNDFKKKEDAQRANENLKLNDKIITNIIPIYKKIIYDSIMPKEWLDQLPIKKKHEK